MGISQVIQKHGESISGLSGADYNAIISLIKDGNRRAATFFVEHYYPFASNVLSQLGGLTHEDKEEISFSVLLKLMYNEQTISSSPYGYVKRTVLNHGYNHIHYKRRKFRANGLDIDGVPLVGAQRDLDFILDYGPINDEIQQKRPRQMEVFRLRYVEGYNVNETAKILDITAGTVKSQSNRVKDKLKESFENYR